MLKYTILSCILCILGLWVFVGVPNNYDVNCGTSLYENQIGYTDSCKGHDIKYYQNSASRIVVTTCSWTHTHTHTHIPPYVVCFHFMHVKQWMQNKYAVILFCFQAGWCAGMQAMGPHVYCIWGETNKHMHKAWLHFNQKVWQFQSLNMISIDNPSVDSFLIHFSFWGILWHHSFTKYTRIECVWSWKDGCCQHIIF